MIKNLLSFFAFAVLFSLSTVARAEGTEATPNTQSDEEESPVMPFEEYLSQREFLDIYYVSTAAEFLNHWKQNHSIAITADIDLSSFKKSEHQAGNFTGELCSYDPDGVTRYKLTNIPETMAQHMTNAYIHDICFEDSRPKWDGGLIDNARGTSLVARYGKNCRVDNVTFRNVHVVGKDVIDTSSYGAIIFSNDEGSTFIDIEAYECTVYINSNYAAILCAKSEGSNFYRCLAMATCAVYTNGGYANDGYAGAIAGYAKDAKFTECNSLCSVSSGKDGIGGIVGHGENCTFSMCNNYGCVTQKTIGSAEALENAAKQMGAMTVTGSKSFERLVAAGQDNGLGNVLGLASQTEAYTSISLLEKSLAQAYEKWVRAYDSYEVIQAEYDLLKDFKVDDYCLKHPEMDSYEAKLYIDRTYTADKFLTENNYAKNALDAPVKATSVAHRKVITSVLRGLGIALSVYQIWSQIYDELDSDEVGGIVGYLDGGSIRGCSNYGLVYCTDVSSGGIVGEAHNVNITSCLNQGLVQGYGKTGGIVGLLEGGSLKTSLNVGNVSNGNSSNDSFGRTYGEANGATISRNFFAGNVDRSSEDAQVAEVSLKMLATGEVAMMLNQHAGGNMWRQSLGLDYYPNLAPASDTVKYSNPAISDTIRTKYASDFLTGIMNQYTNIELEGDIELNTSLANFSSRLMPFQGSINGHGHRLKNLYYVANELRKSYWWWSNDNENKNVGLFSFARNATFKDLELCDFNLIIAARTDTCGLLVGNSANCTYENVHITGHSTIQGNKPTFRAGGLVGSSKNDTFTDCTTGALCKINGATSMWITEDDVEAGGIVGVAVGSNFTKCINRAEVKSNNDYTGGIVANIKDGKLERCVNLSTISGCEYLGGIVGYAEDTEIHRCANTGLVNCVATAQESEVGGIVGRFAKNGANKALYECANWGNIYRSAGEKQGAIYGDTSGSPSVHDNYYSFVTEDNDHPEGCFGQDYVLSGEWTTAYNAEYDKHLGYYYQDIDRNSFGTHYPVPVAIAGEITKNYDCKTRKFNYSNLHNAGEHTTELNKFGLCQECGSVYTAPSRVEISNSQDLVDLAYAVNKGQNFSNSLIEMTADIDFKDNTAYNVFQCIGRSEHPFSGVFDGNYHTISNLVVEEPGTVPGLFSTVTGNTSIRNLILDNTCALRSNGWGAGGIVGCSRGSTRLNLTNLGFEGFVSGYKNVGAILGGTFSVEGATIDVTIGHCYNTGTVQGDTESASLCGYTTGSSVIYNSWNIGQVTGYTKDDPVVRGNYTLQNSYDVNAPDGSYYTNAEHAASGQLAWYVNECRSGLGSDGSSYAWYQQIGVDKHPTFFRNTDHLVYHHHYYWCDAPNMLDSYFDNDAFPEDGSAIVKHDFDEKGICLRKAGEIHGEECPVEGDCWKVSKMGHLYNIAEQVNSGAVQHDIDLQDDLIDNYYVFSNGTLSPDTQGFREWTPIGWEQHPYTHKFSGNNHTISGLYINLPEGSMDLAGLFGIVKGSASISKVGIINSYFNNASYAGSIAAYALVDADDIENRNFPNISNCYASDGAIMNVMKGGGGILGHFAFYGETPANFETQIVDCYNTSIVAPLYSDSPQNAGGILGSVSGGSASHSMTANCYYLEGCTTGTSDYGKAKTESDFRYGEVCQQLNHGQRNVWSQAINKQKEPVFGEDGVAYSRTVEADSWGTLVLPFPVTSDENVQFYTFKFFSGTSFALHLEKASVVPANTPCFFKTSDGCSALSIIAEPKSVVTPTSSKITIERKITGDATMYLIGSYDDITVSTEVPDLIKNFYVAQNKLCYSEEPFNLPAFQSYMKLTNTNYSVDSFKFIVDEDTDTGISSINNEESLMSNGKYLHNGNVIIIHNGKKFNTNGQRMK